MTWDELTGSLDFSTLRTLYATRALRPTDVVRAVYRRIALRGDDAVWIHLVPEDEALAVAERIQTTMDVSAPLFGLPCAIKDNIDVPGMPSTSAFPPSRTVATTTGRAVKRILESGAIVIGKTNMDQFGIGIVGVRSPYGVPRNPFDADFIPGGSSSGSGVAVSAGLVSFALGNDAAGSGRVPAAFNHVIGIKPTPGLVSNTSVVAGGAAKTIETLSVFSLLVPDGMKVLSLIAGHDPEDLFSQPAVLSCDLALQDPPPAFRFVVPRPSDLQFCGDPEAARLFEGAIRRLERLGGRVSEVDYSVFMEAQKLLYEGPFLAERDIALAPIIEGKEDALHPATRAILASARHWTAQDTFRAMHRLAELTRDARRLLAGVDAFVVPTTPTIFKTAQIEADPIALNAKLGTYTNFVNLMRMCGTATPSGFRSDGMPLGITVLAAPFQDARAAAIAAAHHRALETTLGATRNPPPAQR